LFLIFYLIFVGFSGTDFHGIQDACRNTLSGPSKIPKNNIPSPNSRFKYPPVHPPDGFLITIERSPSNDEEMKRLIQRGLVDAVTLPDLGFSEVVIPLRRYWSKSKEAGIFEKIRRSYRIIQERWKHNSLDYFLATEDLNAILTIAAHTKTEKEIRKQIQSGKSRGAKAVLVVSGGGPKKRIFQRIPWAGEWLVAHPWMDKGLQKIWPVNKYLPTTDSVRVIQIAREMMGPDFQIWAVANPNTETIDRLQQKIEAGADGIITHPMFRQERCKEWWQEANEKDLTRKVKIRVTIPVITSVDSLQMWFVLTGITPVWRYLLGLDTKDTEAQGMLKKFRDVENAKKEEQEKFYKQWTVDLIQQVRQLPEVAGIHLIPMEGMKFVEGILEDSQLITPERKQEYVTRCIADLKGLGVSLVYETGLSEERHINELIAGLQAFKETITEMPENERPASLRVYFNRISGYHFRAPVVIRPFAQERNGKIVTTGESELAVNLRALLVRKEKFQEKSDTEDPELEGEEAKETEELPLDYPETKKRMKRAIKRGLSRLADNKLESNYGVRIGDYVRHSQSLIWQFNREFWKHVFSFMEAHGRDYADAIGGSPDGIDEKIEENAKSFLEQLEEIDAGFSRRNVYVDLGAGSPYYATRFLKELTRLAGDKDELHLLSLLKYVFADYSGEVLQKAEKELGRLWPLGSKDQFIELEYVTLDIQNPYEGLSKIEGEIQRIHMTNVLDNIPTDKLARVDGQYYLIQARLYLPTQRLDQLAQKYEEILDRDRLKDGLKNLGKPGMTVDHFLSRYCQMFQVKYGVEKGNKKFYHFWLDLWRGLKLEERYVLIPDLTELDIWDIPGIENSGEIVERVLNSYPGNIWIHLSNGAIRSMVQLLVVLAPQGVLEMTDTFILDIAEYHQRPGWFIEEGPSTYWQGYKGDIKYEGALMDWVNIHLARAFYRILYHGVSEELNNLLIFGKSKMHTLRVRLKTRSPFDKRLIGSL